MYQSVSGTVLKLIQEGLFSNVTVIINDHEFKSNSLLLASSSDYFRALFSFQQKSVEEPRLEIKCDYVSHVGLSHVMLFINSIGQIHDSIPVEDYQDVYIASSFLQVHYLQKLMSLQIMNLAHWFDDDPLFKKAILFLWHEFQSVDYFSSDFVNLTTKQITKIFQSDQINISQERVVLEALLIWLCHDVKQRIEFFENNFLHLVRLPLSTLESYGSQSNEFMVYNEDLSVVTPCTPPYAASRVHHAVAASLNWIYVVGGESEEGELLNHCSRFSLTDLVWYSMSELDSPRSHHTLICIENYLYIFGGYCLNWSTNYSPASDSILTYDISTNKWSNSHHKLPFGLVMFAGGLEEYGDEMRPSDCAFLYDPIEEDGENFKFLPKLPTPLISVALACDTVEDQVFLCGGRMSMYGSEINDISNKVFSFKFSTNCWTQVTVLDFPRYSAFSFVLYDKLYVIGGITVDEVIENTSSSLLASLINIDSDDSLANRQQTLTTDTVRNITSNLLEQFSFGDYIRPNILQAPFRPCHFTEGWQLRSSQSSSIMLASTSSDNFYTSSTQSRPKRLKLSLARYNNHLPVITRCYAVYCIAPYLNCIK
ncbi:Kelch-like protein 13 [Schistosoma japonicum]|nr:Kelch-like protein 13 [Schistosoma japonicum]